MAITITPRSPMYDMFTDNTQIGGTENQRYNDHDKANARYHVNEIDTRLSFDNLTTLNYVKDNNLEIDYGGAITLRQNGSADSFLMSDGLTRPGKLFKIGICLRDDADDKSLFDKYMFTDDTHVKRYTYMDETGCYTNLQYTQINQIIDRILLQGMPVEIALEQYRSVIYDQVYYVLDQLKVYHDWVKSKQFKNDTERLNAYHNILWLFRAVFIPSLNDSDSFKNNSDATGKSTNSIDFIVNGIIDKLQIEYMLNHNVHGMQNSELNGVIKTMVSNLLSPIRIKWEPDEERVKKILVWIVKSYITNSAGREPDVDGGIRYYAIDEIFNGLKKLIDKYGERDENDNVFITPNDVNVKVHIEHFFQTFSWAHDVNRIIEYLDQGVIETKQKGTRWIPALLKFERIKRRPLTLEEKRQVQLLHFLGKVKLIVWSKFDLNLKAMMDSMTEKSELKDLFREYFILNSDTKYGNINAIETFSEVYCTSPDSKDKHKYWNYICRVLGWTQLKSNQSNWININPFEVGSYEMEHFLAENYGIPSERSDIRKKSINFFSLDKTTNNYVSNDDIKDKVEVVKNMDNTIGMLFNPTNKLDDRVFALLNSDEYQVFRQDDFDNEDWVRICTEGLIGDNVKSQLPNNLIYKYRKLQFQLLLEKVYDVKFNG